MVTPSSLLRRLAALQTDTDPVSGPGLFPSYRIQPDWGGYRRADVNVFFTASIVFVLQQLRAQLPPGQQTIIDHIRQRAQAAYPQFRNKDGLPTYNFWPTTPSRHFPNGRLFHRFDHFRIPDDIDDTAMVYLTSQPPPADARWLTGKLAQHANLAQAHGPIRNTFPEYRDLPAFSTWFGKHMPVDFDACAMSNMLYYLYAADAPETPQMTASLHYLRHIVLSGRYKTHPFRCSPHYARTSLIIYHLARLAGAFPVLEAIRPRLIADTLTELPFAANRIDRLMLRTSLYRLAPDIARHQTAPVDLTGIEADFSSFHFFIAGLLTAYEHPLLNRLADHPFVQLRWQCDAHCLALLLEYLLTGLQD
ncbi:hypothetical protein [Arsenicibacter rosenii]|uniref:Uncharacterized protein n=1 Tax=Arsenicibacter rosenii TaxID=1750698 RepID=A0A1S2VJ80_9BACT|nr:hypothetical protein [Arsenicibacter rosenii]OIN58814.1 hypothetical protein BLX24_11305 [Arsenicibacter rosenii]